MICVWGGKEKAHILFNLLIGTRGGEEGVKQGGLNSNALVSKTRKGGSIACHHLFSLHRKKKKKREGGSNPEITWLLEKQVLCVYVIFKGREKEKVF